MGETLAAHQNLNKNDAPSQGVGVFRSGALAEYETAFGQLPTSIVRGHAPTCNDRNGPVLPTQNPNC